MAVISITQFNLRTQFSLLVTLLALLLLACTMIVYSSVSRVDGHWDQWFKRT